MEIFFVSIPFIAGQWSLRLHLGPRARLGLAVSIPFIAGQWSLPEGDSCAPAGASQGFNPLHCGAVVASRRATSRMLRTSMKFQSPSLRGSGRFVTERLPPRRGGRCFNPLHCGAVVASTGAGARKGSRPSVSIPFIAGQWSLRRRRGGGRAAPPRVSIPFIAGQWSLRAEASGGSRQGGRFQSPSLRGSGRFKVRHLWGLHVEVRFNPLHCGAVVASPPSPDAHACAAFGFNPLHCGAVVASSG